MIKKYFLIILLHIMMYQVNAQSRWTKVYHGEKDAFGHYFTESYDFGYLLVGKHGHNYVHFNWLIKTDINGDVLWEKTIGEASSFIGIFSIDMNDAGELFFAGATTFFDTYNDPMISKLNLCGEKEWCKVFYTPENFDYAYSVFN